MSLALLSTEGGIGFTGGKDCILGNMALPYTIPYLSNRDYSYGSCEDTYFVATQQTIKCAF